MSIGSEMVETGAQAGRERFGSFSSLPRPCESQYNHPEKTIRVTYTQVNLSALPAGKISSLPRVRGQLRMQCAC